MSTEQDHFDAARQYQAYYDETCREIGMKAPEPTLGQTCNDYRRETLRTLKRVFLPQNHELYQVQYRQLRADALQALEPQLLKAVIVEAQNPRNVPLGELREIQKVDPRTGHKMNIFIGQESFVRAMGRPGRLAKFRPISIKDHP